MFVDSHVNLHSEAYSEDLDAVIMRAQEANVGTLLTICCKISEFSAVLNVAKRYDNMYASVGTHPHEAKENPNIKPNDIINLSNHPKVIGIGETGLDFHYNYSDSDDQYANFRAHIEAARNTQLPLIIHSRNADKEMAELLEKEMGKGYFPALLHCYTGGEELAQRAANIGLYFSLSGILTFKNAHDLREIAKKLPEDRLLIETDCPYLAPIPYRGRRNEPAYVSRVAEDLALLREWSLEETAKRTTDAFFNLFSKAKRPEE
ncbi:MAG: TatD family hydrolase [Robiginitomaculum sp.]